MARKSGLTLWKHEKKQTGKRVFFTAGEPLAWQNVLPLVQACVQDKEVAAVYVATQGFATGELYAERLLRKVTDKDVISRCAVLVNGHPTSVITCPEPPDNRDLWAFLQAKSQWKAQKLFYMIGGWVGFGVSKDLFARGKSFSPDLPDAIFCNDDLAKQILARQAPGYAHTLVPCGTPYLQNVMHETRLSESFREEGRRKLLIRENAFVILYLGDVPHDYLAHTNKVALLNEQVLEQILKGCKAIASQQKGKKDIYVLVKPHPRDVVGIDIQRFHGQYPNLRLYFPQRAWKSLNPSFLELLYASDMICSIAGTETFLAAWRGRCGVFVDFPTTMGFSPLNYLSGPEVARYPALNVAKKTAELTKVVERCLKGERPDPPTHSHNIINTILQYF